jgi:formate-dependent nitrite reductase membrane component NrfD
MDPKVNGQLQEDWNWLVAIYLFLGGVGAGAYTIAAVNSFIGSVAPVWWPIWARLPAPSSPG